MSDGKSGPPRGTRSDRLAAILDLVGAGPRTIDEIADAMGVSVMTVYRDVATLEGRGTVHRQRGIVSAAPSRLYEATVTHRMNVNSERKAALAEAAATLVSPGESVVLDDSTTGVHFVRRLDTLAPLTVITNSLAIARELHDAENVTMVMPGGQYVPWAEALVGPVTVDNLRTLRADVAVMSVSAIADDVCYHPDAQLAEVKRAMLASADRSILYVDGTKFGRAALYAFTPVADFDVVVVEHDTDPARLDHLRSLGVEVVVAGPPRS
jgi:DeoR/GlpR family transcriptional regulator of sugar metabolism